MSPRHAIRWSLHWLLCYRLTGIYVLVAIGAVIGIMLDAGSL